MVLKRLVDVLTYFGYILLISLKDLKFLISNLIQKMSEKNDNDLKLEDYFELTEAQAAMKLGISVTKLKNVCRERNIPRWPHRRVSKIHSIIKHCTVKELKKKVRNIETIACLLEVSRAAFNSRKTKFEKITKGI